MENKLKHLEMIQAVISRMANNSFALKGWAVTLVAGIYVLASIDTNQYYFLIAYIPIIAFAGLDAYYLLQEKLFRALYDNVCKLNEVEIDFSMDTSCPQYHEEKNTYLNCLLSGTVIWFYLPLLIVSSGVIIITCFI